MKNKNSQSKLKTVRDNTTLGYFTGTYINKLVTSDNPKAEKLNKLMLKEISSDELSFDNFDALKKIPNSFSGLPLVGGLLGKIGHYGLIFTASLGLCQYYKKKSPALFS